MSLKNVQLIQKAVDSFRCGDLEGAMADMAEDIDFLPCGPPDLLPWVRQRRGTDGSDGVAGHFADILAAVDYELFEAEKYLADDHEVAVLGRAVMRFKATGQVIETDFVLRFEVRAGEIVRYRDSWDTAAAVRALRPELAASS